MKMMNAMLALMFVASSGAGCTTSDDSDKVQQEGCDGASPGSGALSCEKQQPVNADGASPGELANPPRALQMSEGEAPKAARTYTGACTGIWYGCSRVQAEGWYYESCGSSHYVFMTFDGAYGNLTGYGVGYCWF